MSTLRIQAMHAWTSKMYSFYESHKTVTKVSGKCEKCININAIYSLHTCKKYVFIFKYYRFRTQVKYLLVHLKPSHSTILIFLLATRLVLQQTHTPPQWPSEEHNLISSLYRFSPSLALSALVFVTKHLVHTRSDSGLAPNELHRRFWARRSDNTHIPHTNTHTHTRINISSSNNKKEKDWNKKHMWQEILWWWWP